jgi:hypothetical protein
VAGILDADGRPARAPQDRAERAGGLGEAAADERPLRAPDDASHPPEVRDQGRAQRRGSPDVAVRELAVGGALERGAVRPQPFVAREAGVVRKVRPQVEPWGKVARRGRDACGLRDGRNARGRSAPENQVALRAQLGVGVDHESPRDAELRGRGARGGKRCLRLQPSAPHGLAQSALELHRERLPQAAVERHQQLGSPAGPRRQLVHEIGIEVDLNSGQNGLYRALQSRRTRRKTMGRLLVICGTIVIAGAVAALAATGTPEVVARIETGAAPCSETGGFGHVRVGSAARARSAASIPRGTPSPPRSPSAPDRAEWPSARAASGSTGTCRTP